MKLIMKYNKILKNKNYYIRVGGMATPLGVYLTTGNIRAGSNDFSLILTGIIMITILIISTKLVEFLYSIFIFLPNSVEEFLILILFLFFLRNSSLSGYHASEHMTVNAIENKLPLHPSIISHMPRFHPRCGTNFVVILIGAQLLLNVMKNLIPSSFSIPLEIHIIYLILIIFIFISFIYLSYLPLGKFLQNYFTTQKPNLSQIYSGINAGKELLEKYQLNPNYKAPFLKQIWNIGILQVILGWFLIIGLIMLLEFFFNISIL